MRKTPFLKMMVHTKYRKKYGIIRKYTFMPMKVGKLQKYSSQYFEDDWHTYVTN